MKKGILFAIVLSVLISSAGYARTVSMSDEAVLGQARWSVDSSGNFRSNSSGYSLCLGDDCKAYWGTVLYSDETGETTDTLTAAQTGYTLLYYTSDTVNVTLPTAAAGLEYTIVDGYGTTINIDTGLTTDTIKYLNLDAGDKIASPGATSDSVTVFSPAAGYWYIKSMKGTWTDGGA